MASSIDLAAVKPPVSSYTAVEAGRTVLEGKKSVSSITVLEDEHVLLLESFITERKLRIESESLATPRNY